ncbi:MAG: T9SS type A sorting domain-containing protein [Flavobacterium sp.]|nr:T9SS type A sorting domain-containing protein [Flavobacterium sp.]
MKKIYIAIALFVGLNVSMAQTKSTGVVSLNSSMTLKIDMNSTNSTVTLTLTGPDNKWFGIGFNATSMGFGTDCLYYSTSLVDSVITGQGAPTTDASNEWIVSSNTVSGTTRSLVLTRNFAGGSGDYTFAYNNNSLNVIWAYGSGTAMSQHAGTARGSSNLGFTLGFDDFTSLNNISIAPNPSNGIFNITKNIQTTISKVTVFDINGKILKVVDSELSLEAIQINLSDFSKGVYFLEITNDIDKVVRKIIIE